MSLYEKDLIVALATPRGIGALSVIRVSGHSLSSLFPHLPSSFSYINQIETASPEFAPLMKLQKGK